MQLLQFCLILNAVSLTLAVPQVGEYRTPIIKQIYHFPNITPIENLAQTRRGDLLLSTFSLGRLYGITPDDADPTPVVVAELPGVDSVTGIAEVAPNIYAVSAGKVNPTRTGFVEGTGVVFTVDVRHGIRKANVRLAAHLPNARTLNGMAALPRRSGVVLSADSANGLLYRVNTRTGAVDVALSDPLLAPNGEPNTPPYGVNGIRIAGDELFFTNSGRGIFGKVRITPLGEKAGAIRIVTTLEGTPAPNRGYDDFALDDRGHAYVCVQPDRLVRIFPNGKQVTIAGGSGETALDGPTSAVLDRYRKRLFVSTVGATEGFMGQIVEISRL